MHIKIVHIKSKDVSNTRVTVIYILQCFISFAEMFWANICALHLSERPRTSPSNARRAFSSSYSGAKAGEKCELCENRCHFICKCVSAHNVLPSLLHSFGTHAVPSRRQLTIGRRSWRLGLRIRRAVLEMGSCCQRHRQPLLLPSVRTAI